MTDTIRYDWDIMVDDGYNGEECAFQMDKDNDEIIAALEPSDFYFTVEEQRFGLEHYVGVEISPVRYTDENGGAVLDQSLDLKGVMATLPWKMGAATESGWSPFDAKPTVDEMRAAMLAAGFIDIGSWL